MGVWRGKLTAGIARRRLHHAGDRLPRPCRFGIAVDVVDAKHGRGKHHRAVAVADLVGRARPCGKIAVAGSVDEDAAAHRAPAGFGFDEECVDLPLRAHQHTGAEAVKQDFHTGVEQQLIGRQLVGRGVIGLGLDLAENRMRLLEAIQARDPTQQIVGDPVHHLIDPAETIGVQAAEIGHARGGAHASQEAVAFDKQCRGTRPPRSHCCRNAGGPAAENNDIERPVEFSPARRLGDSFDRTHDGSP